MGAVFFEMARRPVSIVVVEAGEDRFVEMTYADGETVRRAVDPKKKPARKPRKPYVRAKVTDPLGTCCGHDSKYAIPTVHRAQ